MRERDVLRWLQEQVPFAGDDCAIIPFQKTNLLLTTDMLWEPTDFPIGTTAYTIGWRTVAVSLSDIAAMGAKPLGVVVALGVPEFEQVFLNKVLRGGLNCCKQVNAPYVGGDLSKHSELTLTSSAIGEALRPVKRSGARIGDLVCVTGELGRTAVALRYFAGGQLDKANELLCFTPRVTEGLALAPFASSMMDISDGLARSLYQLSESSGVGFKIDRSKILVVEDVNKIAKSDEDWLKLAMFTGEDFELLFTLQKRKLEEVQKAVEFTVIGEVVKNGIWLEADGQTSELKDEGYEH